MKYKYLKLILIILAVNSNLIGAALRYNKKATEKLYKGINENDLPIVKEAVSEGANIHAVQEKYYLSSPLISALQSAELLNDYNIVKFLIQSGANVNEATGPIGKIPMAEAILALDPDKKDEKQLDNFKLFILYGGAPHYGYFEDKSIKVLNKIIDEQEAINSAYELLKGAGYLPGDIANIVKDYLELKKLPDETIKKLKEIPGKLEDFNQFLEKLKQDNAKLEQA